MRACGYKGAPVVISHHDNPGVAEALRRAVETEFGTKGSQILSTRGLCSYYAEPGSVMIGFEA
jgi:hypothetical protein